MNNNQDLEKMVGQLQDLPGHILGLNGWLLRTLPKDKRASFLRGFEKLVRVAYFPDHAPDVNGKGARERYIQAVASAVAYLTSDDFAFELAVEDVPTEKNPVIKLKTEMDKMRGEHQKETASLRQKLDSASEEIKNKQRLNQDLQRANNLELERISVFSRLQEHNRIYLSKNRCYTIGNRDPFSISGYFLDFNSGGRIDLLQAVVFRNMSGFDTAYTEFQEILESDFLSGEKETLRFKNKSAKHGDYILRILGGLTIGSIKEFINYMNLLKGSNKEISQHEFRKSLCGMSALHQKGYKDDIYLSNFSIPVLNLGLPILIRETLRTAKDYLPKEKRNLPTEKYSIFYVTGVNPHS